MTPAVRLAEVRDWLSLIDRHSSVATAVSPSSTAISWINLGGVSPDPLECDLRRGVLEALLSDWDAARDVNVRHSSCAASGDESCVFTVDALTPKPDAAHAQLLRDALLVETSPDSLASEAGLEPADPHATGHQDLERELAERSRQLARQYRRVKEADQLKSEFLANVSHELNTPLTCIRGFARLLRRDVELESSGQPMHLALHKRLEFLRIVENEAVRMGELISGLLELSKIESGIVTLDRTACSLDEIIQESLLILKPRLDERSVAVDLDGPAALPQAQLDPDRMKQVVLNLLDNAIKFSPIGGRISIRTGALGDMLQLGVSNTAVELKESQLERIFERFVQRDGSYTRPQGGVGLGLNLVRAIAELHGGTAWAEMQRAGWVEFLIRVPYR